MIRFFSKTIATLLITCVVCDSAQYLTLVSLSAPSCQGVVQQRVIQNNSFGDKALIGRARFSGTIRHANKNGAYSFFQNTRLPYQRQRSSPQPLRRLLVKEIKKVILSHPFVVGVSIILLAASILVLPLGQSEAATLIEDGINSVSWLTQLTSKSVYSLYAGFVISALFAITVIEGNTTDPFSINNKQFPEQALDHFFAQFPPLSNGGKRKKLIDRIRLVRERNGAFSSWGDLIKRVDGLGNQFVQWLDETDKFRRAQFIFSTGADDVAAFYKTVATKEKPYEDNLELLATTDANSLAITIRTFLGDSVQFERTVELIEQQVNGQPLSPSTYRDTQDRERLLKAFSFFSLGAPFSETELKRLLTDEWTRIIPEALRLGLFIREKDQIRMNGLSVIPVGRVGLSPAFFLADLYLPRSYTRAKRRVYIGMDSFLLLNRSQHLKDISGTVVEPFSGSGFQLIMFLISKGRETVKRAIGIEIDERAMNVSMFNAKMNGVEEKLTVVRDLQELEKKLKGEEIDCLLINPPYVPAPETVPLDEKFTENEMREIEKVAPLIRPSDGPPQLDVRKLLHKAGWGGVDGFAVVDEFMPFLYSRLKEGGVVLFFSEFLGDHSTPTMAHVFSQRWPGLIGVYETVLEGNVPLAKHIDQLIQTTIDYGLGALKMDLQKKITLRVAAQLLFRLKEYGATLRTEFTALHRGFILAEKHETTPPQLIQQTITQLGGGPSHPLTSAA